MSAGNGHDEKTPPQTPRPRPMRDPTGPMRAIDSRVLPAVATVERLGKARRDDWTGEFVADSWDDDSQVSVDPARALLRRGSTETRITVDPTLERRRKRGKLEQALRLTSALLAVALVLVFFADAMMQGYLRLSSDTRDQRWREVVLSVRSDPPNAKLFINGRARGTTPTRQREYCGGQVVRVRVEAPGHAVWLWKGVCPIEGKLELTAPLHKLDE
jgi:hypothetical protein